MASFEFTQHFGVPPDAAFDLCTDLRRAAERVAGIKQLEVLTDGPIGVGTKFRETRVMMGKEATEDMEIIEFERPGHYVVHAESCGCRYRSGFSFAPYGGGTDVTFTFDATPMTFMAKIMSPVMGWMMNGMIKKCIMRDMADLRDAAEQHASGMAS